MQCVWFGKNYTEFYRLDLASIIEYMGVKRSYTKHVKA